MNNLPPKSCLAPFLALLVVAACMGPLPAENIVIRVFNQAKGAGSFRWQGHGLLGTSVLADSGDAEISALP
jgi:hypothetical protein